MGLNQIRVFCLSLLLACIGGVQQHIGKIYPGFEASEKEFDEDNGLFLVSSNSTYGFGFCSTVNVEYFVLVVVHMKSAKIVWTANRGSLVTETDKFVFDKNGSAYLLGGDRVVWSTGDGGKGVTSMELMESGNLVLLFQNGSVFWQSFSHPTDTLLHGQVFVQGMMLRSFPNKNNLSTVLEMKSGDLVLYADYRTPQVYWSLANETRKTNSSVPGKVYSASIVSNSWNFYDELGSLLWQFQFSFGSHPNATWAVVLGADGAVVFYDLHIGKPVTPESVTIPQTSCGLPERCGPFYVCFSDTRCECPYILNSQFHCRPPLVMCDNPKSPTELVYLGERLDYFAIRFSTPFLKPNLNSCSEACLANCSCMALFFEEKTGMCFLFDQLGSLTRSFPSTGYVAYMKIRQLNSRSHGNGQKQTAVIVSIIIATTVVIAGLVYAGLWHLQKRKERTQFPEENMEEYNFFDKFSGAPVRYRFKDIRKATKNFSEKIGQGGFGSVYQGILPDGTLVAVKKLEGIGQGKKEFRAEVSIIGSVHHMNLVKLKGFCIEGAYRLLVYEYMGKGSLDKWIFSKNDSNLFLDWDARFSIILGTAKGLAYLHEECEAKIVHCDIKPENVLLDDNFKAKVSDFGLAKLMNREDSLVYTTVRGTRGYLAPEWISNHPISEKSDVYSFGVVLLEIIGGRKHYDAAESSEKSHLPSYSFKMLEDRKLKEIVDPMLTINENGTRVISAIKVALWCIQENMDMRPPMTKVVQMLEGICSVPDPPISSQPVSKSVNWTNEESSGYNSNALFSDIELSGPR